MRTLTGTILGGAALVSGSAIVGRVLGFVSAPILTHALGPAPYGEIALAGTVIGLLATIALMGRELGYMRLAMETDQVRRRSIEAYLWRSVGLSALLFASVAYLLWQPFCRLVGAELDGLWPFVAISIALNPLLAMSTVRRRLLGGYGRIALASLIGSVAGVATSISWALLIFADVWALAAGGLVTLVVTLAIQGGISPQELFRGSGLAWTQKRDVFLTGFASIVTAPIYWAIMSLDRWFLGANATTDAVGIYTFATQFALVGLLVNNGVSSAWLPEVTRLYAAVGDGAKQEIAKIATRCCLAILLTWMAVSAAGGDLVRLLSAEPFHAGTVIVPWIAASMAFYGLTSLMSFALLANRKMDLLACAWVMGGVIALALYALLAPILGLLGVAIGHMSGFITIAVATLIFSQRVLPLPLQWVRLAAGMIAAFFTVLLFSTNWATAPVVSLALKLPAGLLAAILVTHLMCPDLVRHAVDGMKSRLKGKN